MKPSDLKRKKALAIYEVYRRGLEEGRFSSMRNAGDWVASQPAPGYFIPAEKASLYMGMVQSGMSLSGFSESQRKLIRDLYRRYTEWMDAHPGNNLPRVCVMEEIVDSPAPEFYMTGEAARKILRGVIRDVRRRHGW